ncbi:DUF1572 family protein [Pelagicoccus sp. NFK12]|uniref:DUF1572 family protein n=1 Tax=Pelagicoccus enzymogenes TaxID=2773457 RepID=A0A927FFG4_9BACT|nr:DUF1572 family protein [Pelagicoccus enzymogenes]MBD5782418.1 DUF1572 family protein [Pelagicoccus enzymogenes]MDQ8200950.1 DUF1572 family protein [Pelagicoccus enzymogenes]
MTTPHDFVPVALGEFRRLKQLADKAVAQVSEQEFFQRDGTEDNSLAILYKHVSGNMRSRWSDFLTTDGEKPDRNRDSEFELHEADSLESLKRNWESGWKTLFDALEGLEPDDIQRSVSIRGEGLSVLEAIARQMTHYAYHVGQIVYLAKRFAGERWQTLSIAKGKSAAFNQSPEKYKQA